MAIKPGSVVQTQGQEPRLTPREWGKRAADRFHRFYISSQDPKCLQETRSSRMIIIKKWKEEMGKGYKEESMDQRKRENF